MQDRFNFRFWDKKNNLMIYPSEQLSDKEYTKLEKIYLKDEWYITPEITLTDSLNYFDNRPFEIMQCTGLKDKNGKLIFEKDIIKCSYHSEFVIGVVEWDSGELQFALKIEDAFYSIRQKIKFDKIEILGNIYENPEFLERGEMTKEIMIICPNRNLKSYIFNLQHENSELKRYFLDIEDVLELPNARCIGRNSLEYYAILSSSIKFQIQALKERASLSDPRSQQLRIKKLKVAFLTYRRMQFGKDLRRQEYEYLYLIENLLKQLED